MSLLILDRVTRHFGPRSVLEGADLQVDPGEKVGLVGPNGAGKTTLVALVAGLDAPDRGRVIVRKGARVGHVPQRPEFAAGVQVREHVAGGLSELRDAIAELERVSEGMAAAGEAELERLMKEHQRLEDRIGILGGWEVDRRVETVLSGLGLGAEFWEREARTLSGGEKSRVALARELVAGHDLLLLDEPTNHLDLEGIEWIEAWLRELKGAVLIVSHDRRLLDNAVDSIVELERGTLRRYPGNYSKYVALRSERYESELRAWKEQQEHVRKEEAFVRKHLGSQRTGEAKGRQKRLASLERLPKPFLDVRRPVIRPPEARRGGELVLEARGLSVGHGDRVVLRGVDLRVGRGDRVGVVGRNGGGKSTLLRALAGRHPLLAGELQLGHEASCGYYDQDAASTLGEGTVIAILRRDHPHMTDQEARDHLARFLFRGDAVEQDVESLSGGERGRLALARLVLQHPSWLALDEPTNHLDLGSRAALEEMLGEFQGALVCVSHDRAFLDGLCTRIVAVDDGGATTFEGNYTQWRRDRAERAGAEQARARAAPRPRARAEKPAEPQPAPANGRIRNPYKFQQLEERIIALEEELTELQTGLADEAVYRDPDRMRESQVRIAEVERELQEANEQWENWS